MATPSTRPPLHPDTPRWTDTLLDRSSVLIRPLRPRDREAERAFIDGLSLQSRRFRFLGQVSSPSAALLDQLLDVDMDRNVAFAATVVEDGKQRIVGVGRYNVDDEGSACECAVTVADEWLERGLGTALMRHLVEVARSHGIRRICSVDSAENVGMAELVQHLGFHSHIDPEDSSQCIHSLELGAPG